MHTHLPIEKNLMYGGSAEGCRKSLYCSAPRDAELKMYMDFCGFKYDVRPENNPACLRLDFDDGDADVSTRLIIRRSNSVLHYNIPNL